VFVVAEVVRRDEGEQVDWLAQLSCSVQLVMSIHQEVDQMNPFFELVEVLRNNQKLMMRVYLK